MLKGELIALLAEVLITICFLDRDLAIAVPRATIVLTLLNYLFLAQKIITEVISTI